MDKKLREELIRETHLEDIAETYRPVAEIVGGSALYVCLNMPVGMRSISRSRKNILVPARNRRIQAEYNGYNIKTTGGKNMS